MERAGLARSVSMKLLGHRTASIFERYAIVAESDLVDGVRRLAGLEAAEQAEEQKQ